MITISEDTLSDLIYELSDLGYVLEAKCGELSGIIEVHIEYGSGYGDNTGWTEYFKVDGVLCKYKDIHITNIRKNNKLLLEYKKEDLKEYEDKCKKLKSEIEELENDNS